MPSLGVPELLLLLLIAVVIFGAKRIPELGSSIGKGIRNFKESMNEAGKSEPASGDDKKS